MLCKSEFEKLNLQYEVDRAVPDLYLSTDFWSVKVRVDLTEKKHV
jgi:hypothetical protein